MLSKTYTLKITNNAQGAKNIKIPLDVEAQPIRIVSQTGDAYQIIDDKTGLAPNKVLIKRVDNDLYIRVEEEGDVNTPDIIIDNYYDDTSHVLIGEYKPGHFADYISDVQENAITTMQIATENQEGWFHLTHETNDGALLGILGGIGLIAAASGGGGDGNHAPSITSDGGADTATINVSENQSAATDVNATDSDGDTITYSIVGGADAGKFTIDTSTGVLSFVSAPDYEYPDDDNKDNAYNVMVQASDGKGGVDTQTITINLNNVNDNDPRIDDAITSLAENSGNGTAVYNVNDAFTTNDTDRDGEALTYSITGGNASGAFAINASTGAITVADYTKLDYETTPTFNLTVQASDGVNSDTAVVTVNLNNLNDNNPRIDDATTSLAENSANGTSVYNVNEFYTTNDTDLDGQPLTYSITGGNASGAFVINASTGAITVADYTKLDYETTPTFNLNVQASDGTNSDTATVTVNLNNLNDNPPRIDDYTMSFDENNDVGSPLHNVNDYFTGSDLDRDGQALTYSIIDGNASGAFAIDASTGLITIVNSAPLDYETTPTFNLTVQASDGINSDTAVITVNRSEERRVGKECRSRWSPYH